MISSGSSSVLRAPLTQMCIGHYDIFEVLLSVLQVVESWMSAHCSVTSSGTCE